MGKCKGYCEKQSFKEEYKAKKYNFPNGYYNHGAGRCTGCEIFIVPGHLNCPCCGRILKKSPSQIKYRRKYVEIYSVRY